MDDSSLPRHPSPPEGEQARTQEERGTQAPSTIPSNGTTEGESSPIRPPTRALGPGDEHADAERSLAAEAAPSLAQRVPPSLSQEEQKLLASALSMDLFRCPICLELAFKPVGSACGHVFCFWCVHRAMRPYADSACPMCRRAFTHFPRVCTLLHHLLSWAHPEEYRQREEDVREEERQCQVFSPEVLALEEDDKAKTESQPGTYQDPGGSPSLRATLSCGRCGDVLFQPVILNCGHVFCLPCAAMGEGKGPGSCATSRRKRTSSSIAPGQESTFPEAVQSAAEDRTVDDTETAAALAEGPVSPGSLACFCCGVSQPTRVFAVCSPLHDTLERIYPEEHRERERELRARASKGTAGLGAPHSLPNGHRGQGNQEETLPLPQGSQPSRRGPNPSAIDADCGADGQQLRNTPAESPSGWPAPSAEANRTSAFPGSMFPSDLPSTTRQGEGRPQPPGICCSSSSAASPPSSCLAEMGAVQRAWSAIHSAQQRLSQAKTEEETRELQEQLRKARGQHVIHVGVGCDCCGAYPIVGKRFRCTDCYLQYRRIGFDQCQSCHTSDVAIGRFNQRHTREHHLEEVQPQTDTFQRFFEANHPDTVALMMALMQEEGEETGGEALSADRQGSQEAAGNEGQPAEEGPSWSVEAQPDNNQNPVVPE